MRRLGVVTTSLRPRDNRALQSWMTRARSSTAASCSNKSAESNESMTIHANKVPLTGATPSSAVCQPQHVDAEEKEFCSKSPPVKELTEAELDLIRNGLDEATRVLPGQPILERFVHHNPLERFEHMPFTDAVKHVHELERYMTSGERAFELMHIDPRKRVNEAISDLAMSFLDRGAVKWRSTNLNRGFLYFFATLEGLGLAPWRRLARSTARTALDELNKNNHLEGEEQQQAADAHVAERIVYKYLQYFGIPKNEITDSIRASLLEVRGWAAMFDRMARHPDEAPDGTAVRLVDLMAVRAILMRSSITSICGKLGKSKDELAEWIKSAPKLRKKKSGSKGDDLWMPHTSAIAYVDQQAEWRESYEANIEQALLEAIGDREVAKPSTIRPKLQVWACIDDREESFRRHIEEANPIHIETFGVPGFFGLPFLYKPWDGREQLVQAPVGHSVYTLKHTLQEIEHPDWKDDNQKLQSRQKALAQISVLWERFSFSPVLSLLLCFAAPISCMRLFVTPYAPTLKRRLNDKFENAVLPKMHTVFKTDFSEEEAAELLARVIKDIGARNRLAPLIVVMGHGSTSRNNPYHNAYQCGACQGQDGGPNARLCAQFGNDVRIRAMLASKHDIHIPDDTHFVAGNHNTTSDVVDFYDQDAVPESHKTRFAQTKRILRLAGAQNALERSKRFFQHQFANPEDAQEHTKNRSTELSQIRPELNHATNVAVIVGRRDLTKNRFLDRRAFLSSYDPFEDDDNGTSLERVLTPALLVGSGINLEYFFSTANVKVHGAGTKVPLNVVGNIGVLQGTTGDLRLGLPSQMTEMHTPSRSHYFIDSPVDRLEKVLKRNPNLMNIVRNEWVKVIVRDPETNQFLKQHNGKYIPISSETSDIIVDYTHHQRFGYALARKETLFYRAATIGMLFAWVGPIALQYGLLDGATTAVSVGAFLDAMSLDLLLSNPRGAIIATCATALSLPVLAFSRQYLHGEYVYPRFQALTVALLFGFNIVATAPTLMAALNGWSLFGFASVFLIGIYNERPTVRNNTTFVFAGYRLSDFCMLMAAIFAAPGAEVPAQIAALGIVDPGQIVAAGLLLAAFFKSSQFPLTTLFARSMEGPTPSSALGYAGLSAHLGVVLLATTMPMWIGYDFARITLTCGGLTTAVFSGLVCKIRADRKGAVAYATSGTIGLIMVVLAAGYGDVALLLSFGHAAFRIMQILRAPGIIQDNVKWKAALGGKLPWPITPPNALFRLAWFCRRIDTDFHLLHVLRSVSRDYPEPWNLTRVQQWIITAVVVLLCGAPYTPVAFGLEHEIMELAMTRPFEAIALAFAHFAVSVILMRLLLARVLHSSRFHRQYTKSSRA